ncbi:MAG: VCBS repeat-containing protein, partial [Bacteroidetes bacterium]|nr:VCBS repeat-containing protein [Bacteroidota bacterium]
VDGDGDLDIYLEYLNNPDRIFLNDGAGNFTDSGQEIGLATGEGHGVFYDLDLDGDQDLMLPNHENGAQVFTNIGTGQFEACGDPFGEGSIAGILDADLDGLPDLITSNFLGSTNFYKNFDNCLYRPYGNLFPDEVCWSISTEDVDGDGDMDVILGNTSMNGSATKLFLNRMINTSVELTYAFVEQELKVYPNPASDFFQIDYEISTPGDYHIQLVNILSQETTLLVSGLISEGTKTLKFGTQNRPTGHYLCELLKDGIVIASKKLCLIK